MILELFRKDVRLRMCVWTLDRLASVEFFLWNSVPSPDSLSLPDVPLAFPLYTREAGRQTLQSCAWAGCFGAGWCLSLPLSCVRVSQSVISITNFIRSEKATIFDK